MATVTRARPLSALARRYFSSTSSRAAKVEVNMLAAAVDDSMKEGVGTLKAESKGFSPSDWVVSTKGFGPWGRVGQADTKDLLKVSNIPVEYAALALHPCKAYRLLADFGNLKPGDVVIHYGGETLVGQALAQLGREKGLTIISVVRPHHLQDEIVNVLKRIGAEIVIPEHLVPTFRFHRLLSDVPKAALIINDAAGNDLSSLASSFPKKPSLSAIKAMKEEHGEEYEKAQVFKSLLQHLKPGGTVVSYDVKGDVPSLPQGSKHERFDPLAWFEANDASEMLDDISRYIQEEKLHLWVETFNLKELEHAKRTQLVGWRKVVVKM